MFTFALLVRRHRTSNSRWIEKSRTTNLTTPKPSKGNRVTFYHENKYFQISLEKTNCHFQKLKLTYSEVRYQFETHINSYLQFWKYIKESFELEFHLDQIQYFLSFQMSFYRRSKFQSLSGKLIE